MRQRVPIAMAAALVGVTASSDAVSARHYCAGPAGNFSAYDYQSPGGIRGTQRAIARAPAANTRTVPYPQSCGTGRVWKGGHCVRE
jgi:hypothetical protein